MGSVEAGFCTMFNVRSSYRVQPSALTVRAPRAEYCAEREKQVGAEGELCGAGSI